MDLPTVAALRSVPLRASSRPRTRLPNSAAPKGLQWNELVKNKAVLPFLACLACSSRRKALPAQLDSKRPVVIAKQSRDAAEDVDLEADDKKAEDAAEQVVEAEAPQAADWQEHWRNGAKHQAAGEHQAALKDFELVLGCLRDAGLTNSFEFAKTEMSIGVAQAEEGHFAAALESYESAQEIFGQLQRLRSKNGARLLANIAITKAKVFEDRKEVVAAFSTALEAFTEQKLLESKEGVRLLIEAGKALEELERFAEALDHYKTARDTLERARALGSLMGIEVLEKMSDAQFELDDLEGAESNLVMAVAKKERPKTRDALGKAWKVLEANAGTETLLAVELNALMAQASIRAGNFEEPCCGLQCGRGFQDTEAAAEVFYNLGVCYSEMEDLDQAIESFESAASSLKAQGPLSSSFATEVCGALADAYFEAEDTSKAVETYELACQSEEAYDGDETTLALLLTKRGLALAELDDLEDALKDHEQARSVAEEGDFLQTGLGADILVNMGIAKAKGQLLEEAVADFERDAKTLQHGGCHPSMIPVHPSRAHTAVPSIWSARSFRLAWLAQQDGQEPEADPGRGSGILALGTTFVVACARKNWSRRKSSFTTFGPKDAGKGEGRWVIPRLWQEFRDQAQPHLLIPATLISMSLAGTASLRAFLTGRLLDTAINIAGTGTTDAIHALAPIAGFYFAAALYGYFANVVQGILFALARWRMSMQMRRKLFKALMRQEVAFFEKNSSGGLVSRLTNDTDQLQNVLNRAPENLVTNLVRLVVSLVLMAKQHLLLTVISVAPLPLAFFLVKKTGEVVGRYGALQNDALARVNGVASEAITNVRAVQLAGGEETETQERRSDQTTRWDEGRTGHPELPGGDSANTLQGNGAAFHFISCE
eukprot:g4303.t1